jgi:hypothetical protein
MFSHAEENSISHCTHLPAQLGSGNDLRMLCSPLALKAEELPEFLRPKLTEMRRTACFGIAWHVSASAAIANE